LKEIGKISKKNGGKKVFSAKNQKNRRIHAFCASSCDYFLKERVLLFIILLLRRSHDDEVSARRVASSRTGSREAVVGSGTGDRGLLKTKQSALHAETTKTTKRISFYRRHSAVVNLSRRHGRAVRKQLSGVVGRPERAPVQRVLVATICQHANRVVSSVRVHPRLVNQTQTLLRDISKLDLDGIWMLIEERREEEKMKSYHNEGVQAVDSVALICDL
jgi:hypothetical protein